jgi:hypothetical protein
MPPFNSIGTSGVKIIEVVSIISLPFGIAALLSRSDYKIQKCDFYLILYLLFSLILFIISFLRGERIILDRTITYSNMLSIFSGEIKIISVYFFVYFLDIKNKNYTNINFKFAIILIVLGILQRNFVVVNDILLKMYPSKVWDNQLYHSFVVSFRGPVPFLFGFFILIIFSIQEKYFLDISLKNILLLLIVLYVGIIISVMTFLIAIIVVIPFFLNNKKYLILYLICFLIGVCYFLFYGGNNTELKLLKEFVWGFLGGSLKIQDFLLYSGALQARFEYTLLGQWKIFLSSPVVGIGPIFLMDSFYISILMTRGVIGIFLFFAFIVTYYRIASIQMKFVIVCMLIISIFQGPFMSGRGGMLLWALMGLESKIYKGGFHKKIYDVKENIDYRSRTI